MAQFYHFVLFWRFWRSFPILSFFYIYEPFLRVQHILSISSHFYECGTFLPLWVIFTSSAHFYHFEPFLRERHIFTILSHFYECDTFLPIWAIFTRAAHFYDFNEGATMLLFWANLVPRAHVSFGQRQDTELWNNPFQESKILGHLVLRRMRALV